MVLRVTTVLGRRIGVRPTAPLPLCPDPYLDWSGNLFDLCGTEHMLLLNTATCYPVLFPAEGIATAGDYVGRVVRELAAVQAAEGILFANRARLAHEAGTVRFSKAYAPTVNRVLVANIRSLREMVGRQRCPPDYVVGLLRRMRSVAGHPGKPVDRFHALGAGRRPEW